MSEVVNRTDESSGGIVLTAKKIAVLVKIPNELLRFGSFGPFSWTAEEENDTPLIVEASPTCSVKN